MAHFNREVLLYKKGEFGKVIADCDNILEWIRDGPRLTSLRGVLTASGAIDPAIADFTQAIKLTRSLFRAYYNRRIGYYEKGEFEKAIADYSEAARLNPKYAEAFYGRGCA